MFDRLRQDCRYALRQMARAPILTAVSAFVLALGIGANASILAVIDGVVFRPPPGVQDADALVEIRSISIDPPASGFFVRQLTYEEFLALRDLPLELGEVAAWTDARSAHRGIAIRTSQGEERVRAELVTSAYFGVLRTPMALGSGFTTRDDSSGDPVLQVVLGHGFWIQRMGGSTDVVGQRLTLNGYPFTIIGVAAPEFYSAGGGDDPIDVWVPANASSLLFPDQPALLESERSFQVIARVARGVSRERAEAVAEAAGVRVQPAGSAADEPRRLAVSPYIGLGSENGREAITIVGGIGGVIGAIILLIACVNVSALLLGRSLARRREIAVRLALGAGRATIIRQLLTESVILGLLAGGIGILFASWALDTLGARLFTFPIQLSPRPGTLTAAAAVAACTGILFGTFPALHSTRASVFTALKDAVAGSDPRTARLRGWFAVAQLALSLPLLTAAALLVSGVIQSVSQGSAIPDPERLVAISFDLGPGRYDAAAVNALLTEGRLRVAALPGVRNAAFARSHPLSTAFTGRIRLPAQAVTTGPALQPANLNAVDPEYFETVGIPVLRGRGIDETDVQGSAPAIVIDEDLAGRLWPGEDPIGRTLTYVRGRDAQTVLTVVGIIRGIGPEWDGSNDRIALVGSRTQFPDTLFATLLVRTTGDAAPVIRSMRETLNALDPQLVVNSAAPMADLMRASRAELTHASAGASGIGALALLLACIGVYAVIAFGVAERTREIGIRVALGASRAAVVRLFVGSGLRLVLIGIAIGGPLTYATVKLLGAGMFGVARFSLVHAGALAAVTVLLVGVAAFSSWIPARRSATVDPVDALRVE